MIIFAPLKMVKKGMKEKVRTKGQREFKTSTTVNDLPNQFALVRLGKKVLWEVSHKYTSYQTLVRRPI